MLAWKWGPALAAGCTIVMKPSELTPLTALYMAQLSVEVKKNAFYTLISESFVKINHFLCCIGGISSWSD